LDGVYAQMWQLQQKEQEALQSAPLEVVTP
jgi:hypothetical protein